MTRKNICIYGFVLILLLANLPLFSLAQEKEKLVDAAPTETIVETIDTSKNGKTSVKMRTYSPKKAAIRSAILPGLGQAYNKKYWKIPIVYGALGTTAAIFFYNLKWYKETRYAYNAVVDPAGGPYPDIHPDLQLLVNRNDAATLGYLRDSYRRDIDYSALIFVAFWGLNVVDAAVDSHLKSFDVSPDLSLKFHPGYSPMAQTNGLSIVMTIGKKKTPLLPAYF